MDGWELEGQVPQNASQSRVRRCFMFVPRDMSERFFPTVACCNEIVSSLQVSQYSDTQRYFVTFLQDTQLVSSFASLACATGDTATAADLPYPWTCFVCSFFATSFYHVEKENMIFVVPRETHELSSPQTQRISIAAHQHISTTNSQQQETNNNHSNKHHHKQQPKCTATAATAATATTAATRNTWQRRQQLFHQAASQNAPSPALMPALAHKKKSQAAATAAETKNSVT